MKSIVNFLASSVSRAPAIVVIVAVVLTGIVSSFATQVVIDNSNEAFSPNNAEIAALETIAESFDGGSTERVFQVIVRDPGGDVISSDGVRTALQIEEAIRSVAGDRLADTEERPAVVSFASPAVQAASFQGMGPAEISALDDDTVDQLYSAGIEQTPPEQAGFLTGMLDSSADVDSATASGGLVLAFIGGEVDGEDAAIATDQALADALDDLESPVEIRPFSTNLLFGSISEFTSEVGRLFAFAGLIIVAILMFVYWLRPRGSATALQTGRRTVADMALTMVTIFMAIGVMQGGGVLLEKIGIISGFSPVTQIVPILIIGLGVDYAIHLTSRYREEIGEGDSVDAGMSVAIQTVGIALVLATLTTVIGFLTNVANPVPALADFGILAALGILVSFLLMLTFVPAVRVLLDRRAEKGDRLPVEAMGGQSERILPRLMGKTAFIAEKLPAAAIVIALVLGGLGYWGFTQLDTRFSFTDFLPEDSPAVETLTLISEEFGGGFGENTAVLVEGEDLGAGVIHNALVDASTAIAQTDDVVTFDTAIGPVAAASSPIAVIQQLAAGGPETVPAPILAAMQSAGMGPDLKVEADADVTPLYLALLEVAPEEASEVIHASNGAIDAVQFDIQTSAGETRVSELRTALDDAFAPIREAGATAVTTSQNVIGDVVINELTASQSTSLFLTLLAATLVLVGYFWFQNRRPFLGVITMAPVALVVLWTYGLMYATGIPFGPVTATLAALAIGIGVPFTIHMARRFEEDRREYDTLTEAIRSTTTHTGGALAGSAFTTMAGFGILVTSSLVPFKQMGQVTVYAIGLSLLAAIGVLPSMLVLWERWHRARAAK